MCSRHVHNVTENIKHKNGIKKISNIKHRYIDISIYTINARISLMHENCIIIMSINMYVIYTIYTLSQRIS